MKTKISGLKKAMVMMVAFLLFSGCAAITKSATFSKAVLERTWFKNEEANGREEVTPFLREPSCPWWL